MRCKTQTFPVLLIALFLVISLAIVGFSVAASGTTEGPEYILRENTWSVEPKFIEEGESVTIKGEVENVGEGSAEQYVDLYINDMDDPEDYVTVNLNPGYSTTVMFEFNETDEIGTYEILVEQPDSGSEWDSQFEVKEETVEKIEIFPGEDQLNIEAGETLEFSAEAYNNDGELMPFEDEDFSWHNADDGLFDIFEAGEYEVKAELEDEVSEPVIVVVEPAEAYRLVLAERPTEDEITAGEVAEYSVEVQDEYGNLQKEGEYTITLEVNEKIVSTATIEDGENSTIINWWTTREPGEYNVRALEEDELLNPTEEHFLTVAEEREGSILAGQWWMFPLSIVVIAAISLVYLSETKKKNFSLNVLSSFGKKKKPETHEWKRNKEPEETPDETKDEFEIG